MRLPAKLLLLAGVVTTVAIATYLLRPPGKQAVRNPDQINNELCIFAPATPYDTASGLDMLAPKSIPADARCPVCGMYPARFPRWAAQAVFKDGASHYFDSPVDLIAFLQKVDRFNQHYAQEDIAVSYVTDFETGQWIKVGNAFFVHGSTALGPMRTADLPAFSTRQSADAFAGSHQGKTLSFAQITPELIQSMNRNVHHRH
jgi:nitrous oxide reductase accessory protein NosL